MLACVGGALSTHIPGSSTWATGHIRQYQTLTASPCGVYPDTSFHATNVNEIASKKYTTNGVDVDGVATRSKAELWIDIKAELLRLDPSDSHKATYGGGLDGWTPEQHEYVIWLSKAVAGVDENDMKIGGGVGATKDQCQQLQKDLSTNNVNIDKLDDATRRTGDHTDEQHTDSSVSVNKRPWHSVAAALTIVGLANTIQKY